MRGLHTRLVTIETDKPDANTIAQAADVLRNGGLVAFATETVYGLGADATNAKAVAEIFEAKGRPANNPLILHASEPRMASECASEWPPFAQILADEFWPGPLTLVLPKARFIPMIVTAGLETVAVRVPASTIAQALIRELDRPIAAPSANRSTGVSPTLAKHVLKDLEGRIDLILDSGPTTMGLESTVVDLTTRRPHILRPGPISKEEIQHALGGVHVRGAVASDANPPSRSPGQMPVHYAPRTRAIRVEARELAGFDWPSRSALFLFGQRELVPLPEVNYLYVSDTPETASRDFYAALHACDERGLDLIVIVPPPNLPAWEAIRDRIHKATRPWSEA